MQNFFLIRKYRDFQGLLFVALGLHYYSDRKIMSLFRSAVLPFAPHLNLSRAWAADSHERLL